MMNLESLLYFFPKVKNRVLSNKDLFLEYCDIQRASLGGFISFKDADSLKERLRSILGEYSEDLLKGISDEDKETMLSSAKQALRHEFDLLGSGSVKLDPIDWHIDFKSGSRWEKLYCKYITGKPGADIKVPWELSRCQHLLWLGEAWLLTKENKYAKEVIDEINYWIDDNPVMYGVNWKCAMDVAFRAVNWMFSINMIADYDGVDNLFAKKISRSLWQHGFFIYNHLEKIIPYSNNHYTSDLVGLLYLGELFSGTKKGRKWLRYALKEYYNEIRKQVLPSGVHYEKSVSYHRMMTEMLSYPVYMLMRMGESIPQDIISLVYKMHVYIASYTKPNGYAPLISDNDDGRFTPFLKRDFREHGYLNLYDSIENRLVATGMRPLFCAVNEDDRFYEDADVAIIRRGNDYLYINHCGYSGKPHISKQIINTHTHNDLLSFELSLDGKDVMVDPGTYLYTSSDNDRNSFRSTSKHNTIKVDDEEQNGYYAPFALIRNVHKSRLKRLGKDDFEGEYTTIRGALHHTRRFTYYSGKLIISDRLEKRGSEHSSNLYFHLAEGIIPEKQGQTVLINGDIKVDFTPEPSKLEIVDDTLSPSYGVVVNSKTIVAQYKFNDSINIKTIIKKYE